MALTDKLTAIANAIRAKDGSAATMTLDQMPEKITAITTADIITQANIPSYVKAEALSVATKVKNVQNANTLTFFVISDPHHCASQSDGWAAQTNESNLHAMMGAKILAYALDADFSLCNGDFTFGNKSTTVAQLKEQVGEIKKWFGEAFRGIPQFFTVGNHDTGEYNELVGAEYCMREIMGASDATEFGSENIGKPYYYDLTDKKVRVICLNTCEGEMNGSDVYAISDGQLEWFANTLKGVGGKSDASAWGIIVIGHYPLDLGGARFLSDVLYQYIKGGTYTRNSVNVNFAGSNGATFIGNFHGHTHCLKSDKLHYYNGGTTPTAYDAHRLATPAASFYRNNEYTSAVYGVVFGEDTNYNKTADTGDDTAFCVNVVDPTKQVIYSICYGAGYDRTISYGPTVYRSITNSLSHVSNSNAAVSVEDGAAYTATLTADSGYTMGNVVVKMGGTDITSTAYTASTGAISIAKVTGDVVITAVATKIVTYTNLVPTAVDSSGASAPYTDGKYLRSSGAPSDMSGFVTTGFIPFDGGAEHVYRIGGEGIKWNEYGSRIAWYKADFSLKGSVTEYDKIGASIYFPTKVEDANAAAAFSTDANVVPPQGAAYFRVSAKGSGANLIVTLDEEIV